MKNLYKCAIRNYLTDCFLKTRREKGFTQEDFSRKLMMDTRSYAALEHGENLCCTLTFILFLCFHCKNPEKLIRDMKSILQEFQNRPIS